MSILITGGAGYIGSHTCLQLMEMGHDIVVVDNLSNSRIESVYRVMNISGKEFPFINADIRDKNEMRSVFQRHSISAVIHFAGLKAVGESNENPLQYYDNNVVGTLSLLEVMSEFNVKSIVFSSSATVYGDPGYQFTRKATSAVPSKNDLICAKVCNFASSILITMLSIMTDSELQLFNSNAFLGGNT